MSPLLIFAIVSMILALGLYSAGVWGEKLAADLKKHHLILFWLGFFFDTAGTTAMGEIAGEWSFNIHSVTGLVALILMAIHAIWATVVLLKNDQGQKARFHRFSLVVWGLWLIPFVGGMIMAMGYV